MTNKCLICYGTIDKGFYHNNCCLNIFNTDEAPTIDFDYKHLEKSALQALTHKQGIPGVQPKLSVNLQSDGKDKASRITWSKALSGQYIFKPKSTSYPFLPENEDLTMHMANVAGILTAKHCLVPVGDNLGYITKRFDRAGNNKIAIEDLCQLTQQPTEHKYRSSAEKIAKALSFYCSYPGDAILQFYKLTVFCFIVGNSDMHLKNYSLITDNPKKIALSPAYDLLSTKLVIPAHKDPEQLALPINGKKQNLTRKDFLTFAKNANINIGIANKIIDALCDLEITWQELISKSFLSKGLKDKYEVLIRENINILN
jgi:serine/threonine-protein kinase HipA